MYIENINPVVINIGSIAIRWYGLFFSLSVLMGLYFMRKNAVKKGLDENYIFNIFIIIVLTAIVGARIVYVLANWSFFADRPELIFRIDRGGLAFHGGLIAATVGSWIYCRIKNINFHQVADLAVPGIAIGIMLVRIGNIFNQEILGREATLLAFDRHPAQIYGSLIGVILLIVHNILARQKNRKPGFLFWSFVLGYTLLRGLIEETFRENPLVILGYINESWGFGFFTAVHLFTPLITVLALYMIRQVNYKQ